jgi:ABC-type polar amino acid transport system ATPase subunit
MIETLQDQDSTRQSEPAFARAALAGMAVTKAYGRLRGVFDVSLSLPWGSVVSVIGANGSGKSTLLRCLALLETLDAGTVCIDGVDARTTRDIDVLRGSHLGVVFQQCEPWPHLSVLGNLTLPLIRAAGWAAAEAKMRAESALEQFGLLERARAMSVELSGGLRQRLCLARAMVLRPRILLLDEVTSALDPDWTERVRVVLREFVANGGAVLSISHQIGFTRRLSDWVVFLDEGRVLEEGPPERIMAAPRTDRLRTYLQNA